MKRILIWGASSLMIPFFIVAYAIFFVLLAIAMIASSPIDAISQWFDVDVRRLPSEAR